MVFNIKVTNITGETFSLERYKGKTILIVNTASKCGYTKQFGGLQELYDKYKGHDFVILGFPCRQFLGQDFKEDNKIMEFCQLNYGVDFEMFSQIKVKGKEIHPLFDYLIKNSPNNQSAIKWNFEKFLINKEGIIVSRYLSKVSPNEIEEDIKELLS